MSSDTNKPEPKRDLTENEQNAVVRLFEAIQERRRNLKHIRLLKPEGGLGSEVQQSMDLMFGTHQVPASLHRATVRHVEEVRSKLLDEAEAVEVEACQGLFRELCEKIVKAVT